MHTEKGTSELEELRSRLLDLTLKNNLLNYKTAPGRSVNIVNTSPENIYKTLILDEKGMKFYPAGKDTTSGAEERKIWKYPAFSKTEKYEDLILNTPYSDIELRKRLYALQSKSRTVFEEQGYPVLYLALGFIQWTEKENLSKYYKAPLLLIPVELERQKVKENYTLKWTGEDPVVSPSIVVKLAEQGVVIKDLEKHETVEDIAAYFTAVSEAVVTKDWAFVPDVTLDLFSFRKFVMYKDLDPESWKEENPFETNILIRNIFKPEAADSNCEKIQENELDDRLPSERSYNIMDADSSQIAVIEEAKSGKNLVVEGPPGTGKSQTIANLIAELLEKEKTVLFVSEKMAALEVVKRRLDNAGLSRFCLELHSQKAKKSELIHELERCASHTSSEVADSKDCHFQINALRNELSGYCKELKEPIGNCGFTPYDLFGMREQYRYEFESAPGSENYRLPKVYIENAAQITGEEYKTSVSALNDLESYLGAMLHEGESAYTHPWAITRPGLILPNDSYEIREQVIGYRDRTEELLLVMRKISNLTDIPIPESETKISFMVETCRILITNLTVTADILNNQIWKNPDELDRLISNMQKLFDHSSRILKYFTPEIFLRNPGRIYNGFLEFSDKNKIVKLFSGDYKKLKNEITGYYYGEVPEDEQILKDLEDAKDYVQARDDWERDKEIYISLFAPVWKDEFTDPAKLIEYKDWILAILTMVREGLVTQKTIDMLCENQIPKVELTNLFAELEKALISHSEARTALFKRLGVSDDTDFTFADTRKLADTWITDIDRLEEWSKFLVFTDACEKTSAAPVVLLLFEGRITKGELIPAYLVGYADSLLREAYNTRPILARFSQIPHEQKIAAFAEYDRTAVHENAKRIIRTLEKNVPEIVSGASRDSEMGILTGEFNRKRNHMSIRMLMTKAGGLVQKIKPCFMMSPLSVAQYLDPSSVQFDVIIFDEASQVKPEDALGALLRGKQLVVMGDSRQLPPTTFFDQIGGNDEDDDYSDSVAGITDMESLLHVCKQSYPTRRLRWHYRSRHESLIAVSNSEFYDGNLLLFPSPQHETADLGLSFVYLPDTIYDRGKAGVNKDEAKAVADAVISYYEKFPHKSLGVATFSTRQQDAITHEVEILLRTHPDVEMLMRPANGENFFVKNLETVQGDERDTILISIGYGFDANHRLSRNFGPLNQAGGERRLNVLITRARERCVVYSNFKGSDLNITSDSGAGLTALANFLTYAENRTGLSDSGDNSVSDASELFSETVARMLEDNGYTVTRNLGCAGFRIDIAVALPTDSGVYMAGILCDGPYYWSSDVARDRDRLRNQVLEGLGWNLVRVWSAEWFQHPTSCTKVLLDFLKDAEASPIKIEEPVPEEIPAEEVSDEASLSEIKYEDNGAEPTQAYAKVSFEPYVCCTESVLSNYHQFSSVQDNVLQTAILEIIEVEGPISLSVLSKRIKLLGNSVRMTAKAKQRIVSLADDLVNADNLTKDDEGFYSVPVMEIVPRERPNKWEFEDVSLAEISTAAKIILSKQFATPKSDLARQTAIVLGFKATAQIKDRAAAAIDKAAALGEIIIDGDVCRIDEEEIDSL